MGSTIENGVPSQALDMTVLGLNSGTSMVSRRFFDMAGYQGFECA